MPVLVGGVGFRLWDGRVVEGALASGNEVHTNGLYVLGRYFVWGRHVAYGYVEVYGDLYVFGEVVSF